MLYVSSKQKLLLDTYIMVWKLTMITVFTEKMTAECDPNFPAKFAGRWTKITESFCTIKKNFDFLKENKYQFYVTLDLEAPLEADLRSLPKSIQTENIMNILNSEGLVNPLS